MDNGKREKIERHMALQGRQTTYTCTYQVDTVLLKASKGRAGGL